MVQTLVSAIQRLNNRGQDITIRRVSVTPGTGPRILDRKTSQSKFVFPTIQRSVKFRDFVDFKICLLSSVVSSLNFYVKLFYFKAFFPAVSLYIRSLPQGPEEMCLSLEHQNPSKTSEKTGYFDRVTVSLHIL